MPTVRTAGPAAEPITLAEAKAHARVDSSTDDALITALIVAARQVCEQELQRTIISSTYKTTLDGFPSGGIDLPFPTVSSITSVKYYDTSNVQQTLSSGLYLLDDSAVFSTDAWPDTYARPNAVEVIYVAGYADAAAVPQAIKQWLLMRVATMYDNRNDHANARDVADMAAPFVNCLLDPFRVTVV